jgi:hypothetical protein
VARLLDGAVADSFVVQMTMTVGPHGAATP